MLEKKSKSQNQIKFKGVPCISRHYQAPGVPPTSSLSGKRVNGENISRIPGLGLPTFTIVNQLWALEGDISLKMLSKYYTCVTSSHKYNVIKSRKSLKRSILHGLSKTSSEKSDTLRIIEVQIFKCWDVKCCDVTNAKPSTLAWPLDDKNIQFPTVPSKYNSILTLAHRISIPVEFGPKRWRHQPSFWPITLEEMNQFRCGFRHLIGIKILYCHGNYQKQVDMIGPPDLKPNAE